MKTYAVVFTPRAERQLAELYAYVADHSGAPQAEKFVGAIVADCLALSSFPARGAKRHDIRPDLRIKGFARRVSIAYSIGVGADVVTVHGVFYGGQDFEPLLRAVDGDD
jgi:toxin ParE1/3/4